MAPGEHARPRVPGGLETLAGLSLNVPFRRSTSRRFLEDLSPYASEDESDAPSGYESCYSYSDHASRSGRSRTSTMSQPDDMEPAEHSEESEHIYSHDSDIDVHTHEYDELV